MTTYHQAAGPRRAFTLVELLVVLSLIAFLAALAILIIPNLNDQAKAPRGAVMLQQWLLTAKNRALRDRAPRGVRLSFTGTQDIKSTIITFNPVTDLQYIEQPDPFIVQPGVKLNPFNPPGNQSLLPFRRINNALDPTTKQPVLTIVILEPGDAVAPLPWPDFSGGTGTDATLWPVQVGDYLVVNDGLPHMITAVGPSDPKNNPTAIDMLTLASPLPAPILPGNPVTNYRIIRSPRVVGDEPLQMPVDIAIDLNTNVLYGNPPPMVLTSITKINATTNQVTGTMDILFSPSGAVVGRGTAGDAIYLWVRDLTLPMQPPEGDHTIVTIQVRTGAAFAYPVDTTPNPNYPASGAPLLHPYAIAQTGRAPQS
jgi:prepilin-type N-terminal cleavage/methylation domain-containing protein